MTDLTPADRGPAMTPTDPEIRMREIAREEADKALGEARDYALELIDAHGHREHGKYPARPTPASHGPVVSRSLDDVRARRIAPKVTAGEHVGAAAEERKAGTE